jgi:hypothetical protein
MNDRHCSGPVLRQVPVSRDISILLTAPSSAFAPSRLEDQLWPGAAQDEACRGKMSQEPGLKTGPHPASRL